MKEKFGSYNDLVSGKISAVRSGDQQAFSELLGLYEPLFSSLLSQCKDEEINEQDLEDIKQELTVVFYNAVLSFELDQKDVNFGLYAKICLRNALVTQMRRFRKRANLMPVFFSVDEDLAASVADDDDVFTDLVKREELIALNKRIEAELSPFENKVWRLYVTGMSCKDIADAVDKSEKSIENAIFRIRKKLRALFSF